MDCSSGEVPFYFFAALVLNIYRHQTTVANTKKSDETGGRVDQKDGLN